MKKCIKGWMFLMLLIPGYGYAQNVGINVPVPVQALSVDRGLNIDHNNQNPGNSMLNALRFGHSVVNAEMAGITSTRTGATNLFGLDFYTANTRRVTITQGGLVGINATPTSYYLEVGGTVKGSTIRSAGSIHAEGGSVNAETSVTAGTNITSGGNITAANSITATTGNIVATDGVLRADGKGVIMSNSANRQKIIAYTAVLSVSNLSAGSSVTGNIDISNSGFTSAPTAYVGNVITEAGDYYRAMLVLENVTTTNVTVRVVNVGPNPISFSGASWRVLTVGAF